MLRNLIAAAAVAWVVGPAAAQPAPTKPDEALVTKVYDLKSVLGDKGKAAGFADMDAVVKVILETLQVGELKPGTDGPQVIERDGGKLEVRAPAKVQAEVGDLIEALVRLTGLAVDVEARVIELDAAAFEKLLKALPKAGRGKPGSSVLFATGEEHEEKGVDLAEANKLLKAGTVVQSSSARHTNGIEATLSARQSVLSFHNHLADNKPAGTPQFVKEGFKLVGTPVVSADRRFVRFKLTEESAAATGVRTRELGEIKGQKLVAQSPVVEDLGATGSAVVDDGGTLLFRLAYAPKDRVWVVVLRPSIFIQAEADALKK